MRHGLAHMEPHASGNVRWQCQDTDKLNMIGGILSHRSHAFGPTWSEA